MAPLSLRIVLVWYKNGIDVVDMVINSLSSWGVKRGKRFGKEPEKLQEILQGWSDKRLIEKALWQGSLVPPEAASARPSRSSLAESCRNYFTTRQNKVDIILLFDWQTAQRTENTNLFLYLCFGLRLITLANMPPKKGNSLFEQRRLQNIAANQEILKDISKTAVKIAKPAPTPTTPRVKRAPVERRERPKREAAVATRASSRLKGEEPEKREAEEEVPASLLPVERPAKKIRVDEDLTLSDVMVDGRKFTMDFNALSNILPKRGADPGVRTFDEDDIRQTTDKDLKRLREQMNGLALYDKWAVNGESDLTATVDDH